MWARTDRGSPGYGTSARARPRENPRSAPIQGRHFSALVTSRGRPLLSTADEGQDDLPDPGFLAVAATNGSVNVVTRSLAVELAPLRVNAISPGTIDTGAWDGLGESNKSSTNHS
ncbi:SDR family oxidoreductase [Streptomyces sp. NPDC096354]|uniref:SDR family oxidoreductase n=1 Tax=Streptomyces sp. NPDC096354 TaxID=3366088 RepID=UPI00381CEE61